MLDARADRSATLPLDAIRAEFHSGAAHAIFLALTGLPLPPKGILTEDEMARAQRRVAAPVRHGFMAGRWLLRSVLAALTDAEPTALAIEAGAHGKLFLAGHDRLAPGFNLSHSGELAALAVVQGRRIGIDIEAERPLSDLDLLARRILGPRERQWFESLPDGQRGAALLAAWTRKEAVLKAVGTGISGGLSSIEVLHDAAPGDCVIVHDTEPSTSWTVRTLSMPPGFHGALAIEGEAPSIVTWQAVPT